VLLTSRLRSKSIVGLDIGASSVKAVELGIHPKGLDLAHVGVAPLPRESIVQGAFLNSAAIMDAIKAALSNGKIRTKDVAVAVAGSSVIVKKVALPAMSFEELEESIRWEAEQYIPFDVNEVNLDFQILSKGESDGQMDVLLVAAKKELIDDYVQVISEAGLRPRIIDVEGFAVQNAYAANCESGAEDSIALVNIGSQTINVSIAVGDVPAFTRDLAGGGDRYTEELQKVLSVDAAEAEQIKLKLHDKNAGAEVFSDEVQEALQSVSETMIGEIVRTLDFFTATAANSKPTRIVLAGGASRLEGLEKLLHEKSGLPVSMLNPLKNVSLSKRFDSAQLAELAPALAVGVGLALRRIEES